MFQKDDVPVLINLPKSLDFADIYFIHDVHFGSPLFDNKKWELLKDNTSLANGDFSSIGNNTRINLYTTNLTLGATIPDSYELRIWLEETGENQNNLMGKRFSGRIKIDVYLKRA